MASNYIDLPIAGVPTYANASALPSFSYDGALAITLDNHDLYEYETGVGWVVLSTPSSGGSAITALTGDVVSTGPGAVTATIQAGVVTLAKMANLAANSIIGNNTGSPATPIALTVAQAQALLGIRTLPAQNAPTTPGAYPYQILSTDQLKTILVSTASARTITLPALTTGFQVTIKDASGLASTNNITIARSGGTGNIDGTAASKVMAANWGSLTFLSDGTGWYVI